MRRVIKRQFLYRNPYQTISRVTAAFGGRTREFFVDDHGMRIGVLAVRRGKVLLVRQQRLFVAGMSLEIPGGRVDIGETLRDAARREFLEETGYACNRIEPLVHYMPGMDTFLNPTHVFLAKDFRKVGAPVPGSMETTWPLWVGIADCLEMVLKRRIRCAMTITALLMYLVVHRGGRARRKPRKGP